jgi:hypothetical protein
VLVTLTDTASEAVDSLFPILERKVINGFSGHYSEQELDQIVELMERL